MLSELASLLTTLSPLVELLLKLTALLTLVWLCAPLLARINPRWQVVYWRAVATAVFILPIVVVLGPSLSVPIRQANSAQPGTIAGPAAIVASGLPKPEQRLADDAEVDLVRPAESRNAVSPVKSLRVSGNSRGWSWGKVLLATWLVPVLALLAGVLFTDWRTRRLVRRAEAAPLEMVQLLTHVASDLGYGRPVRVGVSAHVDSPRLTGVVRPTLLLPKRLDISSRTDFLGIFAHEITHLLSGDLVWSRMIQLLSIGFWFHPLTWGIGSRHLDACERVSDAVAADYMGDTAAYSGILARIALQVIGGRALAGIAMARTPRIRNRLLFLEKAISAPPLCPWRAGASIVAWLVLLTAVGGAQFVEPQVSVTPPVSAMANTDDATRSADSPAEKKPWKMINVHGTVVDSKGDAVVGATVFLREWSSYRVAENPGVARVRDVLARTTTDDRGRFRFVDVPATPLGRTRHLQTPWDVVCRNDGYGMAWLNLSAAQSSSPLILRLAPDVPIHGRVVDPSGNPIANAQVQVSTIGLLTDQVFEYHGATALNLSCSELALSATADSQGAVVLRGVPAERLARVCVSHVDFAQHAIYVATTEAPQPAIRIPDSAGASMGVSSLPVFSGEFKVEMKPAGPTIRGRVTYADSGEPCTGAHVEVQGNRRSRHTVTDDDGRYTIRDAFPSNARLSVSPSVESGGVGKSMEIDMKGVAHEKTVDIALSRGHVVTGTITVEETGKNVPGVLIRARSGNPDGPFDAADSECWSDEAGCFRLVVPEGASRLRIYGPVGGCLLPEDREDVVSFDPRHFRDINAVAGQPVEPVSFLVEQGKIVEGTVSELDGRPVADATVEVFRHSDRSYRLEQDTTTDHNGHFELGGFKTLENLGLFAFHRDSGLATFVRLKAGYSDKTVSVPATLLPTASVTGTVFLDGTPQAGVRVGLDNKRTVPRSIITDGEGRYRLDLIVPGKDYSVTVSSEFHSKSAIQSLEIRPGETRELPALKVVSYTASVSGIVVDLTGNPVEGALLAAQFDSGSRYVRLPTGKDGRFAIDRLPSEPVALTAYIPPASDSGHVILAATTIRLTTNQANLRIPLDPRLAR